MSKEKTLQGPKENGAYQRFVTVISCAICIAHLIYFLFPTVIKSFGFTALHLSCGLVITYLIFDYKGKARFFSGPSKWLDLLPALTAVAVAAYIVRDPDAFLTRIQIRATTMDIVVGILATVIIMEACRRMTGPALPIVALCITAYALWGGGLPGIFGHKGYPIQRIIRTIFSPQGIFGGPLTVSAGMLFMFLLFGAFLNASGADEIFKDLSIAIAGKQRGGPAKIAVIASAIFGTISGSPIANVASTGAFTIPLMKKQGYRKDFAGAVEAAASTGGQIMPPIMGAAAFLMSDMVGIPYRDVCIAALVPALMYYISMFIMVDVESLRCNLKGLDPSEIPQLGPVLRRAFKLIVPVLVLVVSLIGLGQSPTRSAMFATVAIIFCSLVDRQTPFRLSSVVTAFKEGARASAQICSACATAGIVIGILSMTGLGLNFSNLIFSLGGQSIFLSLLLAMCVSIVLGMGLPTSAAYIVTATTMVPALIKLGLSPMACHLFLLYFASASSITPPVAIASYAGAAIADASPMKTSMEAIKLGIVAFIVPYAFAMNPLLIEFDFSTLADGARTIIDFACAILCSFPLASGIQGYARKKIPKLLSVVMIGLGVSMVTPYLVLKLIVTAVFLGFVVLDRKRNPAPAL